MELRGYVGMFVPEKPAAKGETCFIHCSNSILDLIQLVALNDDEVSAPERTQSSAAGEYVENQPVWVYANSQT